MSQCPCGRYPGVLYPCILVGGRKLYVVIAILCENTGVCLHAQVHNGSLVVHEVLDGHGGTYHLARSAVMIELTILQGQYCNLQLTYFSIQAGWVLAKSLSKVAIQIIVQYLAILAGTLMHEQIDGFVGKQPYTNIHKEQMAVHQFAQLLHRRLLENEIKHLWSLSLGKEHTMILGQRGINPKSIAHDIGIGNLLQLAGTDIYITRCYQGS